MPETLAATEAPRLIDAARVAALTGFAVPTVRTKAKLEPDFPKPRKAGTRTVRWVESEVRSYSENLVVAPR